MTIIKGAGLDAPLLNPGAPAAGVNAVQNIEIAGTPTGGSFYLSLSGISTAAIAWSSTNATLLSNVETALEALPQIDGVTVADVDLAAGIGNFTVTFDGAGVANKPHALLVANIDALLGTAPTVTATEDTAGAEATGQGSPVGASLIDTTNGVLYINTGTALVPVWAVVGTQT